MNKRLFKPAQLIVMFVLLMNGQDAVSQFKIPLYVRDNGNNNANPVKRDTLVFGVHQQATYCIDPAAIYFTQCDSIKESELPPPPPAGVFDSRLIDLDSRDVLCVNGLRHNIRNYSGGAQIDTFQIQYQPGAGGYPFVFRWPTGLGQFCDSMRLKDGLTGTLLNVNMLTVDSLRVTNTSIRQLKLYIYGAKSQTAPLIPTLSSPADNATDVDTPITFSWQPSAGATSYIFQISESPTFSTILRRDTLVGTSLLVRPLSYNKTYYWRVSANTPYLRGCFQTSPFQVSTIVLCNPPSLTAPADGATNVSTSPTLTWSAATSAVTYDVQIASNNTFTQNVTTLTGIAGTSVVAGPFPNCVTRYWRVRTICDSGPSDYSATRSFTVVNAIPSVPNLLLPAANAVNVQVTPSVNLTWTFTDSCSRSYRVQVVLDTTNLSNFVVNDSITTTSRSVAGLQEDTDYFWRVQAASPAGVGNFTAFRKFRTILNPPPPPSLLSPANADTTVPINAILRWSTSVRADSYQVQVATDAAFNSVVFTGNYIVDTTQTVGLLASCTQYYWRARAKNAAGAGNFSSSRNFTIASAPPVAPTLTFPLNGQDSVNDSPTLTWSPGDVCTKFYKVVVSINANLSSPIVDVTISSTSRALSSLESNTTYFWQVTPIGNAGQGTPSAVFSFIITPFTPPPAPGLASPSNGQPDVPLPVTLCWDSAARATTYRLQVSTDSLFGTLIYNDSTLTVRCKQLTFLLNNRTYFWRVNAKNSAGTSVFSDVYKFTTLSSPQAPILDQPINGATGIGSLAQCTWSFLPGQLIESYRFQLSRDSLFTQIVEDDSTVIVPSTQAGPLASHTKYYWRVRAKNSAGSGPYSQVFSFTTDYIGVSNWRMWLNVRENGNAQETIFFGLDPKATAGIDPSLNEFELPPPDFLGTFDVRFVGPPLRPNSIGEGLRLNVLEFRNYTQVDTYKVKFQPGFGGYPITFTWSRSIAVEVCDSMVIMDEFGGSTLRKRMDLDSIAIVTNTSLVSLLIIKYGAHPVLDVPLPEREIPRGFVLSQNYPNPFNPSTSIRFSTEQTADIQLYIYDMLGRLVARLADRTYYPGEYSVVWNGMNDQGISMPSGLYYARMTFVQINAGDAKGHERHSLTRKMLMIK